MFVPPFFSVIIPTYNRALTLKIALKSLVAQTYKNFEVLVCDDGSTDNTAEVVSQFKDKFDITYLWEKNWGGPAHPRNNGIKAAKGDWLCFLDSDDSWYPHKLEEVAKYTHDYDFIYHELEAYQIKNQKKYRMPSRELKKPVFDDLFVSNNPISNSSVVVRKSVIMKAGGFNEDIEIVGVEDYDLWLKISHITDRFKFVPLCLGSYLINDSNISTQYKKMYAGYLKVLSTYNKHFLYTKAIKNAKCVSFPYLAITNKKEALKLLFAVFRFEWRFLKGVVALILPESLIVFLRNR